MKEFIGAVVYGAERTAIFILAFAVFYLTAKFVWWLWAGRSRRHRIVFVCYGPSRRKTGLDENAAEAPPTSPASRSKGGTGDHLPASPPDSLKGR
jgi:hypothetical protein